MMTNIVVILNILALFSLTVSIVWTVALYVKRRLNIQTVLFLLSVLFICLFVAFSSVLEHKKITMFFDSLEEYFEILIIPFFIIFLYSFATEKELEMRRTAERNLQASLKDREALNRELHHRIKNNIQKILSIINLQTSFSDNERVEEALLEVSNRVAVMGLVHQFLYELDDLSDIDASWYIKSIAENIFQTYHGITDRISITYDIPDEYINIDFAMSLGLIVNELLTNAIQHAFADGESGRIEISVRRDESGFQLTVCDDGVGLSDNPEYKLGFTLIQLLVRQYNGEFSAGSGNSQTETGGTRCFLRFGEQG